MSKMATLAHTSILTKMYILYKNELIYNYPKLGIYPNFYKIHNKAIYGHFFVSKTSDASHPQVNIRYMKKISLDRVSNAQ